MKLKWVKGALRKQKEDPQLFAGNNRLSVNPNKDVMVFQKASSASHKKGRFFFARGIVDTDKKPKELLANEIVFLHPKIVKEKSYHRILGLNSKKKKRR